MGAAHDQLATSNLPSHRDLGDSAQDAPEKSAVDISKDAAQAAINSVTAAQQAADSANSDASRAHDEVEKAAEAEVPSRGFAANPCDSLSY